MKFCVSNPISLQFHQETLSNQATGYFNSANGNNTTSAADFLANAGDDYSNNGSSNHGFASINNARANGGGLDNADNISSPELSLHGMTPGMNATITSGGIPSTHPHQILGSTPLSQIGIPPLSLEQYSAQLSPSCGDSEDDIDSELESNADDIGSNYSMHSKRQKRGILPKHATSVMRAWLFQHLVVSGISMDSIFMEIFNHCQFSMCFFLLIVSIPTRPKMRSVQLQRRPT